MHFAMRNPNCTPTHKETLPFSSSAFHFLLSSSLFAFWSFVLPAIERSISPRKCMSLRELQTTSRIPTVCSPSTSHFSWKNRCILYPCPSFPLCWQNSFSCPRATTVPPDSAPTRDAPALSLQSPSICRNFAILTPHGSPPALLSEGTVYCYSPRCFIDSGKYVAAGLSTCCSTPAASRLSKVV